MEQPKASPRILIVDDEPFLRDIIDIHLRRKGAQCTQAESSPQALQLLHQETFDGIICDVHMPEISGPKLVLNIREELKLQTPIVMITGGVIHDWLTPDEKNLRPYIQGIVHKPFAAQDLYQALNELL